MQPQTRYARSGDVNIAYQVVGSGALDLVYVMGWVSNLDKRGTGLSDRVHESELPTLEQRMDDVRAVMDAVGSRQAPDYPWVPTEAQRESFFEEIRTGWVAPATLGDRRWRDLLEGLMGEGAGGIAVHIGARVAAQAGAGEVLVSSTGRDLVAGSGLQFDDRGAHRLKGVPGEWRLYAVVA